MSTMVKYLAKFKLVLQHLEQHQGAFTPADFTSEALADLTGLSKFHFHRLFSTYTGMSLFSVMNILRMKYAVYQLAFRPEIKVIDIALMAGFESPEAFSRAFKRILLQSPIQFRQNPNWPHWQQYYQNIITIRSKIMTEGGKFQVSVVDFAQTSIAVLQHRAAPNLLGNSIAQFIQWRKVNALPPSKSKTFNLIYDDPNETKPADYRFDIACEIKNDVKENSQGVIHQIIPAGLCAKIRLEGSDDKLAAAISYLYAQWLNESDAQLRDFPLFLERVTLYPEVSEAETITDIYLPIK